MPDLTADQQIRLEALRQGVVVAVHYQSGIPAMWMLVQKFTEWIELGQVPKKPESRHGPEIDRTGGTGPEAKGDQV